MSRDLMLSGGQVVIVDNADYDYLSRWKWHLSSTGYAVRSTHSYVDGKRKHHYVLMHRHLVSAEKGMIADHINRNKLDNRRENLRIVTHSQSLANRGKNKNGVTSKFRGVWIDRKRMKFAAAIKKDRKYIHIGYFDCQKDAARAYNEKALALFGEHAGLNIID